MNAPVGRYGQLSSEKRAEENLACRKIVKEINNWGVSQRQLMMLIYLLSLELEDAEAMQIIGSVVRDVGGTDVFLTEQGSIDGSTDA